MRLATFLLLGLLPALLPGCNAGTGGSCALDLVAELPVRMVGNVPVVAVEINGKPAALVLDTGSDATLVNRAAAARLGVPPGTATTIGGAAGPTQAEASRLDSLVVGGVRLAGQRTLIAERPDPPLDGLLGLDVLVDFDLELDLPHHRVALYRARPCATALPGWTGPAARLPVQQQRGSGHLFVSLAIDGQPLRGMLDSGASHSTLSIQSALDTGLRRRVLDQLPARRGGSVNPDGIVFRRATFKEMRIGPDVLQRPELTISDLPAFAGDVLVGEDYLGTRRVWFSFVLGRVFVAPADH